MSIIGRVVDLLEESGLKQADLCEYIDINGSTFTNWKNRETDPPARLIIPICDFFEISPEYLLTGEETDFYAETDDERLMLELFRQLDDNGRNRIIGRMEEMTD